MRKIGKRLLSLLLAVVMVAVMLPAAFAADSEAAFKNGPYLLAPKTDSMVVVWESTAPGVSTIAYGTAADSLCEPIAVEVDADAPNFQGQKMNLYHYKLSGLQPGTRYYYEVQLENGEKCAASFCTLAEDPDAINLISLSDSHIFATRAELDAAVKSYDPDIILHCGDLVEGTGAQAEQFSFWLAGTSEDDFIHSYPVVYSSGNHDQGDVYFNTYIYGIQDEEYGATVEGDSSFNYGGVHIITMNSNPWGLFQMNSEATGNQADASTIQTIENAMAWLKNDLQSDAAQNAEFRLIMMHHPVSDAYTKRYIPDVIEPGNVDLMIAGHTHSYALAVSDDPAVGAGTVYLTHQDARTYNKKGDFFHITGTPGEGLLTVENYGANAAGEDSLVANTIKIAEEKQQLSYSNVKITPNTVPYNGEVTVSATVTNTGRGIAAAAIPVSDNGETRWLYSFDGETVVLEPGASANLSGTVRMTSLGTHTVSLAGTSVAVDVQYRGATFDYTNIRTKMGDGDISDMGSNKLNIKADVTNIGNEAGTAVAEFKVNGQTVAAQQYALASDETKTVEFSYTFPKAGEYSVTIGNAAPQTVNIEGSIQGMPIVKDLSGNDGYIHGEPEFGTDDKGNRTLVLDGLRDYIEIPDNGGYTVDDACTGMVFANLPSEGTTKGGVSELTEQYIDLDGKGAIPDHNPLMVKGIGLGWGTPYLFRMAVRETGKVTYGVCLLDDNGEFSWNDSDDPQAGIKKDTWVQYTSAFDFETGGDSYQNGYNSAHVDKPAFTAPVKNWEGEPMYIGLGFKNTLQTNRNRGMYHTMLPGAISQVRFYTDKLTAADNDAVRSNQSAAGPKADALKIWLRFEEGDIETTGSHTTEWVSATAAPTALSYDASVAGAASITATVQTSDDGTAVKEEKTFTLQDGQNTLDLSGMAQAAYVRIKTEFVSDLNDTESHVPVLREYALTAGGTKVWNTLVDWNAGTFEGAAGHQDETVYRNYAADFDDYSGAADPGTPVDLSFTDIANHWAKDAIHYVVDAGLFAGTSATTFEPETNMTRGMFVTVLGRLASAQGDGGQAAKQFTDVNASAYYAPYVAWAAENGIVSGTEPDQFEPNTPVSREQMVALLYRYAQFQGEDTSAADADMERFADYASISAYAVEAMNWAVADGLMSGTDNSMLAPLGNATRAEVATLLMRFVENIA